MTYGMLDMLGSPTGGMCLGVTRSIVVVMMQPGGGCWVLCGMGPVDDRRSCPHQHR